MFCIKNNQFIRPAVPGIEKYAGVVKILAKRGACAIYFLSFLENRYPCKQH